MKSIEERLDLHRRFWNRGPQEHPIASIRVAPDFFFARHFEAAHPLLVPGLRLHADMLDVDSFLSDYERMFYLSEALDQDAFWTAEPYTGIPWMEAILGCELRAGFESVTAEPWLKSLDNLEAVRFDPTNPWFLKYLEFTEKLVALSAGRFPVGMPIMRGPSDLVGAIMGQTEMIFALADEEERMRELFRRVTDAFIAVLEAQNRLIPPFHGGSSLGFYHVYCPGKSIWHQDDLSAIMSPALFAEFVAPEERRIRAGHQFTAIHLHPASFFILDGLLEEEGLGAIEVNKDVGGPSVEEMLGQLRRIQDRKSLILWGALDEADLRLVRRALSPSGLFLHITSPTVEEGKRLLRIIRE